ncbi:MAG: GNAT family N-acetyltransferase [Candidatus Wallbacteria bacterium]|nr:GNAT family N-acetyltransferase [Candidatus Wallbacteria bacterium]
MRLPVLETERLVVRLGAESEAARILRYFDENRDHLAPTDPIRPDGFFTESYWRSQLARNTEDFLAGRSMRTFLFPRSEPHRVIGTANLSEIIRGCFHSCFLGYGIEAASEGRGLMHEALSALIRHAFESLGLHRVSANYMPHNVRSGRLLRRLGFAVDGYARDYLLIAGRWEDHVLTSLLNPAWRPPDPAAKP